MKIIINKGNGGFIMKADPSLVSLGKSIVLFSFASN
jgi:hypothetical protein